MKDTVRLRLTIHEKCLLTKSLILAASECERLSLVCGNSGSKKALTDAASLRRIEEDLWRRDGKPDRRKK